MANVVVPLFSLRRYTFTPLTGTSSMDIVIVRAVPCDGYRELSIVARVHTATFSSGSGIGLIAYDISQSPDDPGLDFVGPLICTVSVSASTPNTLYVASNSAQFGRAVRIVLQGKRGASGSSEISLEADLVLKE